MTGHDDIDWARVEALFPDLLDTPPDQRARFLDKHCKDAPALRRELEAMLASSERATVFDRVPQVRAQDDGASDDLQPLAAHTRIGAWRIVRMIGRGGMGEVYLAERAEGGFTQQAAIKLLHGDAARHAQRFEEERRILAQLSHPNIARLLDGGVHGERAWMAMEFIEGRSITEHCRSRALPLPARLKLFHQVCAAVAHAHASLIIHRDLKPTNILVNEAGQVKLLDFGIAKLIDPNAAPLPTHTTAFTPDHAAPEQIEGGRITTATDIYALGVVLYETLSGRLPWSFGDTPLSRAIDRLLREDPPPMSSAAAEVGVDAVPAPDLQGDLDAIVARCLRRLPQDRYATVQALQEDLDRYTRREPVLARRGSRSYVVRLWLRRHRVFAIAASVACLSLLTGLALALWQANIAKKQAARAERVKDFVLAMFREQSPISRGGPERIPATLLQNSIRALNHEFADDPALRGELLDALGETQGNQDDFESGHATLLQALALRQAQHGANSAEVAETERKLAVLAYRKGANAEAMQRARRVIAIWTALGNAHAPDAARAKGVLAMILADGKQRERALSLTSEALADMEAALGPQAPETIHTRFRHAVALNRLGREAEAIAGLRQVIASTEAVRGADAAYLGLPLGTLATLLMDSRQFDEADRLFARAASLDRMHFGKRDNMRLANTLIQHGGMKLEQQDPVAAESLFDQAEAAMPEGAMWTRAVLLRERGRLHVLRHEAAPAESSLHRAFELTRQVLGDNDGITWYTASQWGRALALQGKLDQAEAVQRDALAKQEKLLGPDDYEHALLLDALAETLQQSKRYDEAAAALKRALALTAKKYPQTHPVYRERVERLRQVQQAAARRG